MKTIQAIVPAILVVMTIAEASAAPDVSKLITQTEVEAALNAKMSKPTFKTLSAPLGGSQIIFTSIGLPVKNFALTLRTDDMLLPQMKAGGYSVAKLYQQGKSMTGGATKDLTVKGGQGFSGKIESQILKNGMQLSALTLFGTSQEAETARNGLLQKAANRL